MSLRLHKEKGVNARLTYCPRCGGEGPDLVLVGAHDKVYKCLSCGMVHFGGRPKGGRCQECAGDVKFERKLEDHEKLPGGLCEKCEEEAAEHKKIVEEGGVYFKCRDCKIEGVMKPSDFTKMVREQLDVQPPKPCGIEFNKSDCPKCSPTAQEVASEKEDT